MADPFNRILSKFCDTFVASVKKNKGILDRNESGMDDAVKAWAALESKKFESADVLNEIAKIWDSLLPKVPPEWYESYNSVREQILKKDFKIEPLTFIQTKELFNDAKKWLPHSVEMFNYIENYKNIISACEALAKHKLVIGSLYVGVGTAKYWKEMAKACQTFLKNHDRGQFFKDVRNQCEYLRCNAHMPFSSSTLSHLPYANISAGTFIETVVDVESFIEKENCDIRSIFQEADTASIQVSKDGNYLNYVEEIDKLYAQLWDFKSKEVNPVIKQKQNNGESTDEDSKKINGIIVYFREQFYYQYDLCVSSSKQSRYKNFLNDTFWRDYH